jgi:hypothetical protein
MDPKTLIGRLAFLAEAGRVLSAANEAKIRNALAALQAVLASLSESAISAEQQAAACLALEEALSYDEQESLIRDAIKAKIGGGQNTYVWLIATYPDSAIYSVELEMAASYSSKTYQVSYTLLDGQVTLGTPVEVERVTSYVPVAAGASEADGDSSPNISEAGAPTKTVDGKHYPKSDWAYTPSDAPGSWKLRLTSTPGGDPDPAIVGAAAAAFSPGGNRGQQVDLPVADVAAAKAKVRAAWKKANPDKSAADMPEGIKESISSESEVIELRGDVIPLVEAKAVSADGSAKLRLIAPGWGSSGYYSPELLKRDGPKQFAEGLHMYWDHPSKSEERDRPERSLRDLAGVLTSPAQWEEAGPVGPGLYASAKVFEPYRATVSELAPHIGVSIRASGMGKDGEVAGRKGKIIEGITQAFSTDWVTVPGAGGQAVQLFESARGRNTPAQQRESAVSGDNEGPLAPKEQNVTEQEAQALREANATLLADVARLKEAIALGAARELVSQKLAESKLPEITRARLAVSLVAAPIVADGALDVEAFGTAIAEAIRVEADYVAALTGGNPIKGLGTTSATPPAINLKESWKQIYLRQGKSLADAEKMAELAAGA